MRAHDLVGRVSVWGRQWCAVSPVDDRTMTSHGGVRSHDARAMGGTVTVIRNPSDVLVARGLVGRELWIRDQSEGTVCPSVWWGDQHVIRRGCTFHGSLEGMDWAVVYLRHVHRGPVRISTEQRDLRMEIDAIAAVR